MKKFIGCTLLGLLFSTMLSHCSWCDDCDDPGLGYEYQNMSKYSVEISTFAADSMAIQPTGSIEPGGEWSAPVDGVFLKKNEFETDPTVSIRIEFLSEPAKCLDFSGEIQDSASDFRSEQAYVSNIGRTYVIDASLFDQASNCE